MVWAMVIKRDNDCDVIGTIRGVSDCKVDENGSIISLYLDFESITQNTIETVGNYTSIEKMSVGLTEVENVLNFEPLSFLKNLTQVDISTDGIKPATKGFLQSLTTAKNVDFVDIEFNQENINELSTLTHLEQLRIRHSSFDPSLDYNPLKNLTNLNELFMEAYEYHHNNKYKRLVQVPDFVFHLTELKSLHIVAQHITRIPVQLSNLTKLEYLDISDNKIDDILPESLNNLPELRTLIISGNVNVKGKVLTNGKLETCTYQETYELCKPKEVECLKHASFDFVDCNDGGDDDGDEKVDDNGYSTNGQCGDDNGKCPPGFCCSKYGWCGKTDTHCSISLGCQSEFGTCSNVVPEENPDQTTDPEVSQNGRCGEGFGKCPNGQCCGKSGYCGVIDNYCLVAKGCQSGYGSCFDIKLTVDGSCGSTSGRCPIGYCCSKYGWCGKSSSYCGAGCQSPFGFCNQENNW